MINELEKQELIEKFNSLIEDYEGCLPSHFYLNMGKVDSDKVAVHLSYHDFSSVFHISLLDDWDTIVKNTKKRLLEHCGLLAQLNAQKFIHDRIRDLEESKIKGEE